MVHVVFIDIGPVVDTLPISMQATSNDLFAECTAINIITRDIPVHCSHVKKVSV